MSYIKLRRDKLRRWLKSRPKREFVGFRRNHCACPIAHYLINSNDEEFIIKCVSVVNEHITVTCENPFSSQVIIPPRWAREFIIAIDISHWQPKVLAQTALKVLDSIPRERSAR